jgi:hypothetical protein
MDRRIVSAQGAQGCGVGHDLLTEAETEIKTNGYAI